LARLLNSERRLITGFFLARDALDRHNHSEMTVDSL
jgi:hypothetical protein